jgi:hypothetical protein
MSQIRQIGSIPVVGTFEEKPLTTGSRVTAARLILRTAHRSIIDNKPVLAFYHGRRGSVISVRLDSIPDGNDGVVVESEPVISLLSLFPARSILSPELQRPSSKPPSTCRGPSVAASTPRVSSAGIPP